MDGKGNPVVGGVRAGGSGVEPAATMSEGAGDQMLLAFRLAGITAYCAAAEPLPFIADDLLVHVTTAGRRPSSISSPISRT